tara:strand:- start:355 stop:627 length:273 start_codon:yes stop_codon:yes gene_type:complete
MFKPVNRYILVNILEKSNDDGEPLIVLPDDYQPEESTHTEVTVVESAEDVRFSIYPGSQLVVDSSMMEEITIDGTIYNVILDNYVIGITK